MTYFKSDKNRWIVSWIFIAIGIFAIFFARKPHILEFSHYYLGAKYSGELDYNGLYDAVSGAIVELYGQSYFDRHIKYVRYLDGVGIIKPDAALKRFEKQKLRWSESRWREFVEDVKYLDVSMRIYSESEPIHHWKKILKDHGYNASPLYTAYVSPLANALPLNFINLHVLCVFDIILILFIFLLLMRMYGLFRASLGFLFFASSLDLLAYFTFALFRFDCFFALALAFFFIERKKFFLSGVFWGIAVILRIFPIYIAGFFLLTWMFCRRNSHDEHKKMTNFAFGGFSSAILSVIFSSFILNFFYKIPVIGVWTAFFKRISSHNLYTDMLNAVGIGKLFEFLGIPAGHIVPFIIGIALALLLMAALIRKKEKPDNIAIMSIFAVPLVLYLSHYYYLILLFPSALNNRKIRYVTIFLIFINIAIGIAKYTGANYFVLLDVECVAYSAILVTVPIVMFFSSRATVRDSSKFVDWRHLLDCVHLD